MSKSLNIQLQKLFIVALAIKVGSSFFGWYLQMPWSLGFALPLLVMVAYIVLGYYRHEEDVTDEKFADTCYYLGFIFTITSIIFSLFDLPNIGTKIQDIAVRFGAAMVSTVLGLAVRVYLVSFKQDIGDAIKDAEDAVLDATRKFTEQLTIVLERLRDFESQVDAAAKSSVERVNLQVENLSKNHAEKLTGFFSELTTQNQKAFTLALGEVKTASRHLADSVDGYSQGMRSNLSSIEAKVGAFADAVTTRLKTTTFPDDYFARHLETPLSLLTETASELAGGVKKASTEVGQSTIVLSGALKKLRDKATATEGSLDTVLRLTEQQQAVLSTAQSQLSTLGLLSTNLTNFDTTLTNTLSAITASNNATSELANRVSNVVEDGVTTRLSLERSLLDIVGKLDLNADATRHVAEKLDAHSTASNSMAVTIASGLQANADATNAVTDKLGSAALASEQIANKLDGIAKADVQTAISLGAVGLQANTAISKVDLAIDQLQAMVSQLSALDTALRTESSELKHVVGQIKDVKVVVEVPQLLSSSAAVSQSAPLFENPDSSAPPSPVVASFVQNAIPAQSGA